MREIGARVVGSFGPDKAASHRHRYALDIPTLSNRQNKIDRLSFDNGEGGSHEANYEEHVVRDNLGQFVSGPEAKAAAVHKFIAAYAALGVPVIVLYPIPEVGWNVPDFNFKHFLTTGAVPASISTDASRFTDRNSFVIDLLDSIVKQYSIIAVRPSDVLCNPTYPVVA